MSPTRIWQIAAAIVRHNQHILMVKHQSEHDPQPLWALPGGAVEAGELLTEGLAREIREETGLIAGQIGRLACFSQVQAPAHTSLALTFEVTGWHGDLQPNDPDGLILAAAFVPLDEAIARLERIPWPSMRQPAAAYLRGETPAGIGWLYRQDRQEQQSLVAQLGL